MYNFVFSLTLSFIMKLKQIDEVVVNYMTHCKEVRYVPFDVSVKSPSA